MAEALALSAWGCIQILIVYCRSEATGLGRAIGAFGKPVDPVSECLDFFAGHGDRMP
jgi:hypothetical protein